MGIAGHLNRRRTDVSTPPPMDTFIIATPIYGHLETRSWLELDAVTGKLIGMGSCTDYDEHGNVRSYKVEPTGIEMWMEGPEPSAWRRVLNKVWRFRWIS